MKGMYFMFKKQISRKIVAVSFTILLLLSGCSADRKGSEQAAKSSFQKLHQQFTYRSTNLKREKDFLFYPMP